MSVIIYVIGYLIGSSSKPNTRIQFTGISRTSRNAKKVTVEYHMFLLNELMTSSSTVTSGPKATATMSCLLRISFEHVVIL